MNAISVLALLVAWDEKYPKSTCHPMRAERNLDEIIRDAKQVLDMTNARKNITQPADWWTAFEQQATAEGKTLSAWIGDAAKAKLPNKVRKELSDRPPANRPRKE
jgi:hypothetical protein